MTTAGNPPPEFRRELRVLDSTMIVIGSMIGSGVFIVSADIARTVGAPGYLILVWLITGVVTVTAALSYGELASMMPRAGGQYVYLREAYNPLVGFLYGWTMFMVIQTGTIAAVGVAFAKFTAVLFPVLGEHTTLFSFAGIQLSAARAVAIVSIILLSVVNSRGIHGGRLVQNTFTITKAAVLCLLLALIVVVGRNTDAIAANFSRLWDAQWTHVADGRIIGIEPLSGLALLAAIGTAMVGSLFSSDAWNNITFTAGEVVNPRRTIALSMALGTAAVTLVYICANMAYLVALPLQGTPDATDVLGRGIQFASDDRVATAVATTVFGAPGAIIMAALIMVSTFGCNNGLILAGARVFYAMSNDGLFFRRAARLNDKGVPGTALAMQAAWASMLCLTGTYSDLLDYVVFAVLVFYILTVGGIFILRRKRPDEERPAKAIGYPVVPLLYILAAAAICVDLLLMKPAYTWPGVVIVLVGIPVYYGWRKAT